MRTLLLFTAVFLLTLNSNFAQTLHHSGEKMSATAQLIAQRHAEGSDFPTVELFTEVEPGHTSPHFNEAVFFGLNKAHLRQLLASRTPSIIFKIPIGKEQFLELELTEKTILAPDFTVETSGGAIIPRSDINAIFYRGIIKGKPNSLAAISVFENEIIGVISDETGNYNLGAMPKTDGLYVFYNDRELTNPNTFECQTDDSSYVPPKKDLLKNSSSLDPCRGPIGFYLETRYQFFLNKGSVNGVINYVTGFFNVSAVIYANEDIPVEISDMFVHNSADPYPNDNTGFFNVANSFANTIGSNFDGDIAHLLSSINSGFGGFANITTNFCGNNRAYTRVRNNFASYPNYSGTVYIFTHEAGHQLGSPHTHGCYWGPNNDEQIDDCGNVEADDLNIGIEGGDCYDPNNPIIPNGNGTIMSYCDYNNIGINFTLGFGTEPGDLIRDNYSSASCVVLPASVTVENMSGSIPAGDYEASCTIESDGTVNSGTTVTFSAGQSVTLTTGFHAKNGSSFTAQLSGCEECSGGSGSEISCGQTVSGSTVGQAIPGNITYNCENPPNYSNPGVFYSFQGTGQNVLIDFCTNANTDFDASVEVFSGSANNLTCVSSTPDFCSLSGGVFVEGASFFAANGVTYYILITSFTPFAPYDAGSFEFTVTCTAPIVTEPNALIANNQLLTAKTDLQIYPNPVTNDATISFQLPKAGNVQLEVLNMTGRRIEVLVDNDVLAAGQHSLNWSANSLKSGTYLLRIRTESEQLIEKFVLVK